MTPKRTLVVIGGGAAGFFAAIAAAEKAGGADVILLEATAHLLAKVRISGGGRCNVTHACFEPREFVQRYPRGSRELLGAFSRWQASDTVQWFESRGVPLKTEPDGRMFPVTDQSDTIIQALLTAARSAGVRVRERCGVQRIERTADGKFFSVELVGGEKIAADAVLLATGGGKSSAGFSIAQHFGHTIEPLAPSLFTFNVRDPRLENLAGLSVARARVSIVESKLLETGPVLITHWGLSGPAILRLSAWGARELQARDYRFSILVNWSGSLVPEGIREEISRARAEHPRRGVRGLSLFDVPTRLWERLCEASAIPSSLTFASLSNAQISRLVDQIGAGRFDVTGKSTNKDEFVTCGGVKLSEVDFRTMQSRLCPGLFFAGEVLDIDGITGGFNFQAAWTTGKIAGEAMAEISL